MRTWELRPEIAEKTFYLNFLEYDLIWRKKLVTTVCIFSFFQRVRLVLFSTYELYELFDTPIMT